MTDLMNVATSYASDEEAWVAQLKTMSTLVQHGDLGISGPKDQYGWPRRDNRNRKQRNSEQGGDEVNAKFEGQRQGGQGHEKRQWPNKKKQGGPNFDAIMDRPWDYHSPEDPNLPRANHTNRQCYWHRRAMRENNKNKDSVEDDNDDEQAKDRRGGGSGSGGGGDSANTNASKPFPLKSRW